MVGQSLNLEGNNAMKTEHQRIVRLIAESIYGKPIPYRRGSLSDSIFDASAWLSYEDDDRAMALEYVAWLSDEAPEDITTEQLLGELESIYPGALAIYKKSTQY